VPLTLEEELSEKEWQTRKKRIDPKLKGLGWKVVPYTPGLSLTSFDQHAVTEYPTDNGPADYALVLDGGVVGIVEAKKLCLSAPKTFSPRPNVTRAACRSAISISED
jgi:type I restriction enzyme R subunit